VATCRAASTASSLDAMLSTPRPALTDVAIDMISPALPRMTAGLCSSSPATRSRR